MHISNQLVRSSRVAVNSSDTLEEVMSKNPFNPGRHQDAWVCVAVTLWRIKVEIPDTKWDTRWRKKVNS